MFDHAHTRHDARPRRSEGRSDPRRHLRDELRSNLRHHGPGHGHARSGFQFRDFLDGDRRGALVRRGEVRGLILAALKDKPMHGYQVIQDLEAQTDGRWRPSAGSIYPTLQQLADEGLVTGEDVDGRRVYSITDAGRKVAADSADRSPWTNQGEPSGPDIRGLAAAVIQVQKIGSARARREANRIVTEARRELYKLLSEDEDVSTDEGSA